MFNTLVLVAVLENTEVVSQNMGNFESMNECFEAREAVVQEFRRPIKNYQVVCIVTDYFIEELEQDPTRPDYGQDRSGPKFDGPKYTF